MIRFTRFERKILLAMAAVAVMPLVGTLVLGQTVLREAYQVGVNARVRDQLERSLHVYQQYFTLLRDSADLAADAISREQSLLDAVTADDGIALRAALEQALRHHVTVGSIVAVHRGTRAELARVADDSRLDPDAMRLLALEREVNGHNVLLTITVGAPASAFREHQRAGELVEVFSQLQASSRLLSNFYLVVYIAFLLSLIVLALAVGIVMSRRVTTRIAALAEATAKVGGGDLSVQVPTTSDDEVGELTQAFNRMVRDIRESRERIEYLQQIGAWQQFARRLAHEIKNPLTPIQLAVQEVHRSYRGDDEAFRVRLEDAASIVQEEVATLRRLVGEFSEFARLPEAHVADADLNQFVRDAERSFAGLVQELGQHETGASPVDVQTELCPDALPVRIDAMLLRRAVDNLVRNALQAIPHHAGDSPGRVRVRTRLHHGRAILEVADDGPGVPHEAQHRVFDPYFTTKEDGTGLGLAIVKKIILEHGGEARCGDSNLGGASFELRLPLRTASGSTPERILL